MRTSLTTALLAAVCMTASAAETKWIPVTERNGAPYVSSTALEQSAGIAIKKLPAGDTLVACLEDRCARLTNFLREDDAIWISVTELGKALGFTARFSDDRRQVQFEAGAPPSGSDGSITRVGDLAPNFRLIGLEGDPVSLADFRGKRVLIQSWASW